ncbi:MAG: M20/M25/M40 family metallo-hydrolase [Verrucomicrobiales bacterium]|jgi:endoglucanase|nr:M20/M25/M40 family metallo-hydrolase [Verrucomicrobiales bacterium]
MNKKKSGKELRWEFLTELLNLHGPAGREGPVQRRWLEYVRAVADETGSDAYGNAFAVLNPGAGRRVLVVGHADEIGYQVRFVSKEGFLYVGRIGGTDAGMARGQRVLVHGERGTVSGVFGSLPVHLKNASTEQLPKVHELFVDIGADGEADARKRVRVGDAITLNCGVEKLTGKVWSTRAADNRVGIWAAAEVLRRCARKGVKVCVVAVSTIQEENGLYGAAMVGQSLNASAAVVVDVGHATDTPLCDFKRDGEVALGKGPVISRGSVNHPVLVSGLERAARRAGIDYQLAVDGRASGTDADAIFRQKGGIPSAVVSLPLRYMHSTVETFNVSDLDNLADLITHYLVALKRDENFAVGGSKTKAEN